MELPPSSPQVSLREFLIHRKQLPFLFLVYRRPKDYTLHHSLTGEWLGEERSNKNELIYFGTFSCGVRRFQKMLSLWDCVTSYTGHQLNTFRTQRLLPSELKLDYMDIPGGAVVKNPPANAGNTGSSPGPGRSHMPQSN